MSPLGVYYVYHATTCESKTILQYLLHSSWPRYHRAITILHHRHCSLHHNHLLPRTKTQPPWQQTSQAKSTQQAQNLDHCLPLACRAYQKQGAPCSWTRLEKILQHEISVHHIYLTHSLLQHRNCDLHLPGSFSLLNLLCTPPYRIFPISRSNSSIYVDCGQLSSSRRRPYCHFELISRALSFEMPYSSVRISIKNVWMSDAVAVAEGSSESGCLGMVLWGVPSGISSKTLDWSGRRAFCSFTFWKSKMRNLKDPTGFSNQARIILLLLYCTNQLRDLAKSSA